MFQALYLATACGCVSAELSRKANGDVSKLKRNPIPKEGEVLNDRWYNVVQKDSYTWTKVRDIKATYALKTSWQENTKVFMGDVLGMGSLGKVYMCMDSTGRHFALKMFLYDPASMEPFHAEDRDKLQKENLKKLKQNRSTEAKRWKKIYPEYRLSIWEGTLNETPCLAMPYVASIPKERRFEFWGEIKNEMKRIATMGYLYNDDDTRWRHIGLRKDKQQKERVVFLDMESLEEAGEERTFSKKKEAAVDKFMTSLFKRSGEIPEDSRDGLKEKIEEQANICAEKGYLYETEEIRWCNIGLRKDENGNEQVIFVNMKSDPSKSREEAEKNGAMEAFLVEKKLKVERFINTLYEKSASNNSEHAKASALNPEKKELEKKPAAKEGSSVKIVRSTVSSGKIVQASGKRTGTKQNSLAGKSNQGKKESSVKNVQASGKLSSGTAEGNASKRYKRGKKRTPVKTPCSPQKKHKASNDGVESIMNRLYDTGYMS